MSQVSGPTTGELIGARVVALREALELGGDLITPAVAARVRQDLAHVEERLAVGVDHTVVALVGGTGSGKSSLFNAISGLAFAEVGVKRPTTAQATACTWGNHADALLDLLEVRPERRIRRDASLEAAAEAELAGLVLLDLPDHDSIAPEHARLVDRLLPLVDLIVWVVDPQKYADHALHGRYLRALVERQDGMLVLVNQADTVPGSAVDRIAADVGRLLEQDGLHDVPVLSTSVTTGAGIDRVRGLLARVVAGEPMAAWVAEVEVSAVADRLAADLAPEGRQADVEAATAVAVDSLVAATGLEGAVEQLRSAVVAPREAAAVRAGAPSSAVVRRVREEWLDRVGAALPGRWRAELVRRAAPAEDLAVAIGAKLAAVRLPVSDAVRGWRIAAWVALAAAVLLIFLGRTGPAEVAGVFAALFAVVAWQTGRVRRRRLGERRVRAYEAGVRDAVTEAVRDALGEPASDLLRRYRATRYAVQRARRGSSTEN